ncbi:hypothetical protein [Vulcanisaeta sp. JCM 16159]|uniref:hypothetical protein n=1 Tax=Vulcanisaeta sp. JCM 16159 TaxID=1295371 RepID=UPI000B03FEA6|nr:hypothetical protein [Vulcanisaeta sp. JCM 16159]
MGRRCVELSMPNELNELINNAINLAKTHDPSSRVRENAELFIKIHIVPIDAFIEFTNGGIRVKINVEGGLIIKEALTLIGDIKPCRARLKEEHSQLLNPYLNYEMKLLTMFRGYLLCGDVLNYLIWAYDQVMGRHLVSELVSRGVKGRSIIKMLNELFNAITCNLVNYVLGSKAHADHELIGNILKDLRNSTLILLRLNDDCTYAGLY